jgi:Notch-like protein
LNPSHTTHGYFYTCDCLPEYYNDADTWTGTEILNGICEDRHNDCLDDPCASQGDSDASCTDLDRSETDVAAFSCTCSDAYEWDDTDQTCVAVNPCLDSQCENSSQCNWTGGVEFTCACINSAYSGELCEIFTDPCTSTTCGDHGDDSVGNNGCEIDDEYGYKCSCDANWKGTTCGEQIEIVTLRSLSIAKDGVCVLDDVTDDFAEFREGGEVYTTTNDFWTANGATSIALTNTFCLSDDNGDRHGVYTVEFRTAAEADDSGLDSLRRKRRSADDFDSNLNTFSDELTNNPDLGVNANSADDINQSLADAGQTTTVADNVVINEIDICKADSFGDHPGGCLNGSECFDRVNLSSGEQEAYCECSSGFEGDTCENVRDYCSEAGDPCQHDAVCQNNSDSYYCNCPTMWSGDNCSVDEFCTNNTCENGFSCAEGACACGSDDVNLFVATGDLCAYKDFCAYNDPCGDEGTCVNDEIDGGSYCSCNADFDGDSCEHNTLAICADHDCGANGDCHYNNVDFVPRCDCDYGYAGDFCGQRNGCLLDRPCDPVGSVADSCVYDAGTDSSSCTCVDGYDGDSCDIDPCNPSNDDRYTCSLTYSDTDNCVISDTNYGECACLNADFANEAITDCEVWGAACGFDTNCRTDNTESCDVSDSGAAICNCKAGYSGDLCETTVDIPAVSMCPMFTEGEETTKSISIIYISELKNTLEADIIAQGDCYQVIRQRIYGSMQLSEELVTGGYAAAWLESFKNHAANEQDRTDYAAEVKTAFGDAFNDCEAASCVIDAFCNDLVKVDSMSGTDNLYGQLYRRCQNEAWRFQSFIHDGSTDHCQFTIVPATAMEACADPSV